MGCGFSDADWQQEMEFLEREIFLKSGLEEKNFTFKYTVIQMDGSPFAVRTIIYDDGQPGKRTLVMTHGYAVACVYFFKILKPLAEHFRIVMFDNNSWGLNTRVQNVGDALESPQKAEAWLVAWLERTFDKLTEQGDIPEKFCLSGHSAGGHFCMVYAGLHPERIEKLFLQSPPAENFYNPEWTYNPYSLRI